MENRASPDRIPGMFSRLFYLWLSPLISTANQRQLTSEDLQRVKMRYPAEKLDLDFYRAWRKETVLARRESRLPSILGVVHSLYRWAFYLTGSGVLIVHLLSVFLFPHFVGVFIKFFMGSEGAHVTEEQAWISAAGICICVFVTRILQNSFSDTLKKVAVCVKVALSCLIYRKVLQMKKDARYDLDEEQVLKLMSESAEKISRGLEHVHAVWLAPICLFTTSRAFYILFEVKSSLLAPFVPGVFFVAITTLLHSASTKLNSQVKTRVAMAQEKRNKLTDELVSGIHTIRANMWEKPFRRLVEYFRSIEVLSLQLPALITILMSNASFSQVHILTIICTVVGSAMFDQVLSIDSIVLTSIYFYILHADVARDFPTAFDSAIDMFYSAVTVQHFLAINDAPNSSKSKSWIQEKKNSIDTPKLSFDKVVVAQHQVLLQGIDFTVKGSELVCLTGLPGSGKTALLQTAAGEAHATFGLVKVSGEFLYVPDDTWMFHATLKGNILSQRDFDEEKYKKVLEACMLDDIGESDSRNNMCQDMSLNLATKIKFAQALYADADIYLFDNLLDSCDPETRDQIFRRCIKEYLKDKLRIVVTNKKEYLEMADKVIVLKGGKVVGCGTYTDVASTDAVNEIMKGESSCEGRSGRVYHGKVKQGQDVPVDRESASCLACMASLLKAGASWPVHILFLAAVLASQICFHLSDWLLLDLVDRHSAVVLHPLEVNATEEPDGQHFRVETSDPNASVDVYFKCVLAFLWLYVFKGLTMVMILKNSLTRLHSHMLRTVVASPAKQSSGDLKNLRRSLAVVDYDVLFLLAGVVDVALPVCGMLVLMVCVCPALLMPTALFVAVIIHFGRQYNKTRKNIQQMDAKIQHSVKLHLSETIKGLMSVRSLGLANTFHQTFLNHQNKNMSASFITGATQNWMTVRTQTLSFIYLALMTSFALRKVELTAKDVSIMLMTFWALIDSTPKLIETFAELDCLAPNVKWCLDYANKSRRVSPGSEVRPLTCFQSQKVELRFRDVAVLHSGATLLADVNFTIKGTERVGVIGLQGAPKTAFVNLLLKMLNPSRGSVYINEVDTSSVSASSLRQMVSFISARPSLFSMSILKNLDPTNVHSKEKIWKVLDFIGLKSLIMALPKQLKSNMRGDLDLQPHQEYLISLARGLLRKTGVVVIEEPVSSSAESRDVMRKALKEEFADSTVLILTSKPSADVLIDCDRILHFSDGNFHELGSRLARD